MSICMARPVKQISCFLVNCSTVSKGIYWACTEPATTANKIRVQENLDSLSVH